MSAIRDELSALIHLSNEKLEEMRQIQKRLEEVTAEIARLTEKLEQFNEGGS